MTATKPAYGIKSEQTDTGIVWYLMRGSRPITSTCSFATWTEPLATFTDYAEARAALREAERQFVADAWYAADCPPMSC